VKAGTRLKLQIRLLFFGVLVAQPAWAAPTMIRLGYTNCVACHLSPQGRGLLTDYGKAVDEAQSARHGDYTPPDSSRRRKIFQDLRLLTQMDMGAPAGAHGATTGLYRLAYRTSAGITDNSRISATITAGFPSHAKPSGPGYLASSRAGTLVLSKALWEYRPKGGIELAVGRDYLPSGLEIADQSAFIRARNGQGMTEVPTQAKLFWGSDRFQLVPYVFAPSGHERREFRAHGAGLLGETVIGHQRIVLGVAGRLSASDAFDQQMIGAYARLGFGRWGILAEHDLTRRRTRTGEHHAFNQYAGYSQLFIYPCDWLLTSIVVEQLKVGEPFEERRFHLKPEVMLRLTSNATVGFSMRDTTPSGTARSRVYTLQFYLKTVN